MKRLMLIIIVLGASFIPPCLAQLPDSAYFWAGGYFADDVWHDTIYVDPGEWFDVPIYFAGGENVWVADMCYPLGARYDLIDEFDRFSCSFDFWPFNYDIFCWVAKEFYNYNNDVDDGDFFNPPGYHSLTYTAEQFPSGCPWLHSEAPIQILSFRVHAVNNDYLRGLIFTNALAEGVDPLQGPTYIGDTLGGPGYPVVTYYANVKFNGTAQYGTLFGTVTDMYGDPIEGAYIVVENEILGIVGEDSSAADGSYSIPDILYGPNDITFSKAGYYDAVYDDYEIRYSQHTHNVTLYLPAEEEVVIWAGNLDGSPLRAPIGAWMDVPIYFQGQEDTWVPDMCYPLGARYDLLVGFDQEACLYYYPITEWYGPPFFGGYNDDVDDGFYFNPPGYHSLSFIAYHRIANRPFLHSTVPVQILTFRLNISDNPDLDGQIFTDALAAGMDSLQGPAQCGDTLGGAGYVPLQHFGPVSFFAGYEYLLGDANMYNGQWPPALIGSDVTYLVNYFRSMPTSQPCPIDGFWASADVNGDCLVIGSDVTKLRNYFTGIASLEYCPNYPPAWDSPVDIPEEAPEGWPPCE